MTYQVLARKWRPRSFMEMAGQSHVLKTLIHALDHNRLHHAYLFTGTRGVGKTTIARILAKCLNCETGVTSQPCGQCSACREIDAGRFIDLIEVDAASRTKVEDTRELLENVQYAPTKARFKVYLIDEVHMLSGHSFNALLKTLEEPPPHVKFLLATTDPQKLPITVLSRCLQFNLKNLSPQQLVTHLEYVLQQEQIDYEEPALWQLGRAARGSVRDSLTLLDQAISYGGGRISASEVGALLGTIDQNIIHRLVEALADLDARAVLDVLEQAAEHAPDFTAILEDLLSYLHRLAIAQVLPEAVDNSQGDRDKVLEHAKVLPAETVQLYYQIALKGREELPLAVEVRSGLEMTLLRMLAFTPQGVPGWSGEPLPAVKAPASQTGGAEEIQQKKKPTEIAPGERAGLSRAVQTAPEPPSVPARAEAASGAELPDTGVRDSEYGPDPAAPAARPVPPRAPDPPACLEKAGASPQIKLSEFNAQSWIMVFEALNVTGITRNIAANCRLHSVSTESVTLLLEANQAAVYNEEHKKRIQQALREYFDAPLTLLIETGEGAGETPAAWRRRQEAERLQQAVQAFENDETVREILARFSGTIQPGSIVPLKPED